jgi:excisionase family DNA binding protein
MEDLLTTSEAAKLLGVSRVAVFQQIKTGRLAAKKLGKMYLIKLEDLPLPSTPLNESKKENLNQSVDKVIDDYGETLRLLKDA